MAGVSLHLNRSLENKNLLKFLLALPSAVSLGLPSFVLYYFAKVLYEFIYSSPLGVEYFFTFVIFGSLEFLLHKMVSESKESGVCWGALLKVFLLQLVLLSVILGVYDLFVFSIWVKAVFCLLFLNLQLCAHVYIHLRSLIKYTTLYCVAVVVSWVCSEYVGFPVLFAVLSLFLGVDLLFQSRSATVYRFKKLDLLFVFWGVVVSLGFWWSNSLIQVQGLDLAFLLVLMGLFLSFLEPEIHRFSVAYTEKSLEKASFNSLKEMGQDFSRKMTRFVFVLSAVAALTWFGGLSTMWLFCYTSVFFVSVYFCYFSMIKTILFGYGSVFLFSIVLLSFYGASVVLVITGWLLLSCFLILAALSFKRLPFILYHKLKPAFVS